MRKRLTSILLTLAMLVGLLPALSPQTMPRRCFRR